MVRGPATDASSASNRQALRNLQGEVSMIARSSEMSNVPFAVLTVVNGIETLVAAFVIFRSGYGSPDTRDYLQFYSRATGVWKLTEKTGAEFNGSAFTVAPIRSAVPNELWYLVWGKYGGTGGTLNVRLYGFAGWTVRTLWERDKLVHGMISLTGDEVKLKYSPPQEGVTLWNWKPVIEARVPHPTVGLERISIEYSSQ